MTISLRASRTQAVTAAVLAFLLTLPFAVSLPVQEGATTYKVTAETAMQAAVQELCLLLPGRARLQEAKLLTGTSLKSQAESLEKKRAAAREAAAAARERTEEILEARRIAAEKAKKEEEARLAEEARLRREQEAAAAKRQAVVACSERDYEVLKRIVQAEAGGCDMKGKILVANVVMNRVQSGKFPDTITGVVYQKSQFSPVSNGSIDRCSVTAETAEAVDRALSGEDYSHGALYFMNRSASRSGSVSWFDRHLTYLFSHDGHEFFR